MDEIIITTTNDLPGYEVVQVHGEVFGLIVRARNVFSNIPIPITAFARSANARTLGSLAASSRETITSCGSSSSGSPSLAAAQASETPRPFGVRGR